MHIERQPMKPRKSIHIIDTSPLTLPKISLPLHDLRLELNQKDRLPRPQLTFLALTYTMRSDSCREARTVASTFDDTRDESGTVELVHLLGHADVLVDERLVVRDHVLVWRVWVRGLLQCICRPRKEVSP